MAGRLIPALFGTLPPDGNRRSPLPAAPKEHDSVGAVQKSGEEGKPVPGREECIPPGRKRKSFVKITWNCELMVWKNGKKPDRKRFHLKDLLIDQRKRRRRSALVTTKILLRLMAAAANMGFSFQPREVKNTPAARGIPRQL